MAHTLRPAASRSSLASALSNSSNTRPLSFLDLPAELRNHIYRILLVSRLIPALRKLCVRNHCSDYALPTLPIHPALLATCRQIHEEATPLLYGENTFTAHASLLTTMPYLVDRRKPICSTDVLRWIRKWYLNVRLDCDARYSPTAAEEAFNGVDELEIETSEAMFRASGHGVLFVFKGIRGVGRAKIIGSGEKSVYRWLEECMMAPLGTIMEDYDEWMTGNGKHMLDAEKEVKRLYPRTGPEYDIWVDGNR